MSIATLSTNGRIAIPKEIREQAGINPGDKIEISLEGQIIQIKKLGQSERQPLMIKFDEETGLPHFVAPKNAPITDEWVHQQWSEFP
jgi:AbrB family looped-hinge helix DNA binding protein